MIEIIKKLPVILALLTGKTITVSDQKYLWEVKYSNKKKAFIATTLNEQKDFITVTFEIIK